MSGSDERPTVYSGLFWDKWTTPSAAVQDRDQRRQAQLYSQIMLATLLTALTCCLFYGVMLEGEARLEFGLRGLPSFAFLGFCYLIGRSRWYLVGVIVMTGGIVVSGGTVIVLTSDQGVVATMLVLGIISIVYAGALLPAWAIGLTGLGAVSNIALFSSMYPEVSKTSLFSIAAGMVTMTAVYCIRAQVYQVETLDRRWVATRQIKWLRTLKDSFRMARIPMCRISEDGYVDSANSALSQMFGVAMSSVIDSPLEAIAAPQSPMENPFDLAPLLEGKVKRLNTRRKYQHENGQILTARVSVGSVQVDPLPNVLVATLEDITPYMDALDQREKRRIQLNETLAGRREMLALVSREIRSPLTGVVGSVDILSGCGLSEKQNEYLDIIRSSCHSIIGLMDEAIQQQQVHADLDADVIAVEVDLGGVLEEVCRQCALSAFEKGVELITEVSGEVPRLVWADSARLHQVMKALVEGAIAQTDSGVVYCGVRALTKGVLRATLEIEINHSLSGGLDPAFGAEFVDIVQPSFATMDAEGRSLRRMVSALGGSIEALPLQSDVSAVLLRFDWAVGIKRVTRGGGGPLTGQVIWVALEPIQTQETLVRMLCDHGADAIGLGVSELIDLARQESGIPENVDSLVLDVGVSSPDGVPVAEHIRLNQNEESRLHLIQIGNPLQAAELARAAALFGGSQMVKPLSFTGLLLTMNRDLESLDLDREELWPPEPTDVTESVEEADRRRILLVEDEPVHRRVTVKMLGQLGYYVEAVADGRHALELALTRQYDLILMDCRMPHMDGFEATRKLRATQEEAKRVPIIAMSASALEVEKQKCLSVGMDDFLAKPVDQRVLAEMLSRWLDD